MPEILEPQFKNGSDVLIGGNLAGIVISSHFDNSASKYMYRILVSAHDCVYRVYNNKINQNNLADHHLLRDDIFSLKYHCEQYAHLEIYEGEKLQSFDVVNELVKLPEDLFCMNESYGVEDRCVFNCGQCNNREKGTEKMH
jgi:hypothetical protein